MLVDHEPVRRPDLILDLVASVNGRANKTTKLATGVYEIPHFGSSNWPYGVKTWKDTLTSEEEELDQYGVCDNWEQILEEYPVVATSPIRCFITVTPIIKAEQPQQWGWRWHKWGPYIGTKDPQYEYIAQEGPEIEKVYVFHIYLPK